MHKGSFYAKKKIRVYRYVFFIVQNENWSFKVVSWIAEPINFKNNIANDSGLHDKDSD